MAFLTAEKIQTIKENSSGDRRYLKISKLADGTPVRLRFVGEAITGYLAWTENKKPLRWEMLPDVLPEIIKPDDDGNRSARFFLTGIAWNYDLEAFQVVEITQKGLLTEINRYAADEDYGDPCRYDVQITRTGSGLQTEYSYTVKPPSAFEKKAPTAATIFKTLDWDLTRLFEGKHPWSDERSGEEAED